MSILGRYRPERLSSLSLCIPPQTSPVKRVFHSSRLPLLDPIKPPTPCSPQPCVTPICDLDEGFINQDKPTDHSNIQFPQLAPLPRPNHPTFPELLQLKREILNTELHWSDPESDVAAKEIRTKTVKEFLKCAEYDLAAMKGSNGEAFVLAVESAIFKGPPHIDPKWVFSDDTQNVGWELPDSEDLYKIIGLLMQFSLRLKERYIKLLVQQFSRPDKDSERALIVDLLVETYETNSAYVSVVRNACITAMWMYMEGMTSPYVLPSCMTIVWKSLAEVEDIGPLRDTYLRMILPLVNSGHYHMFHSQFAGVVDAFIKKDGSLALPTLLSVMRRFPKTRSNKAAMLLTMLPNVLVELMKVPMADFKANMTHVFALFAKCTVSENAKVSAASVGIWRNVELEGAISDHARIIFPVVWVELSKVESSWSQDIRTNILFVKESMNRIESVVYQDLCRTRCGGEVIQKMKTWAKIARAAAHADETMDLGKELAAIQSTFNVVKGVKVSKSVNSVVAAIPPRLRVPICCKAVGQSQSGGY